MRVIDLALKDLTQTVRDWKAAAFLVVMPIIFTLLIGALFGGGGEEDPRLPVGFLDRDGGSAISTYVLDMLHASGAIRPVVLEDEELAELEERVRDEELAAVVIIPALYGEQLLSGGEARPTILVDESSTAGTTALGGVQATVARLLGAVQAARLSTEAGEAQVGFAAEAERREYLEQALARAVEAWREPPLTVAVERSGAFAEDEEQPAMADGYAHSSPAMIVQFSIAGLIGSAEILVVERKSKALRRLLTTAISRPAIIMGHFLAILVLILLQTALLVGFGQVLLDLDYMREPLATAVVAVAVALWTAGLGLFIGVLARTEEQAVMFAMIPMFVLAGLGGAWMPLEATGEVFQTVGHLMPTAWAMDGFKNILIRGLGIESVLLPAGVMLAYAVLFVALAVWRFKFE